MVSLNPLISIINREPLLLNMVIAKLNQLVVTLDSVPLIIRRESLVLYLVIAKLNLQLVMINRVIFIIRSVTVSMDMEYRVFDSAVLWHTTGNNEVKKVVGYMLVNCY